jgi:hypothetical protein
MPLQAQRVGVDVAPPNRNLGTRSGVCGHHQEPAAFHSEKDPMSCNHPYRVRGQEDALSIVMGYLKSCNLLRCISDILLCAQGPCFVVGLLMIAGTVAGLSEAIREGEGY